MDFDNMKKDKDFQKWCFDTDLVGNKNWFNLENGSGDEVYIAYEAWAAGQQSKQAEIDALKMSNHHLSVQVLDAEAYAEYWQKRSNESQAEIDALREMVKKLIDNAVLSIDDELEDKANNLLGGNQK